MENASPIVRRITMKTNLLDNFDKTTENYHDKIAVVHGDESITFAELKACAQSVACNLINETGAVVNTPVAVFLPKEIDTVIADIAIMYSSNPFMNLDVKTPKERIRNTIALVKPAAVLTSEKYVGFFEDIDVKVLLISELKKADSIDEKLLAARRAALIDTDPMCLINTSGSTGTPKGVVLNHKSFFDFTDWATEVFNYSDDLIIGSLSPVVFDIFDFELCMLMTHASQIVILDASLAAFPARLLERLQHSRVNYIFWVPSIMVNIANMDLLSKLPLPDLRLVWFAGEVFPTKQFLYWYDKLPNAMFVNMYGPIEITLDCTYHIIKERPEESLPLPIGIPCRNTDILILDGERACAVGEEGELCVRGTSLAMGYYNNPEKTQAAFVQNPLNKAYPELIYRTGDVVLLDENGLIQFKGRKDSLIKHMGYRIELGEIENVLINDIKLVEYCCAVYRYSKKEIVLYYESKEDITVAGFRSAMKNMLPAYMLPSSFVRMELLPRNTNGKIDRLLLSNKANEDN